MANVQMSRSAIMMNSSTQFESTNQKGLSIGMLGDEMLLREIIPEVFNRKLTNGKLPLLELIRTPMSGYHFIPRKYFLELEAEKMRFNRNGWPRLVDYAETYRYG